MTRWIGGPPSAGASCSPPFSSAMLLVLPSPGTCPGQARPAAGARGRAGGLPARQGGPDDRPGCRRAAGGQPGRHRLGRGRFPLRRRDDRLSRRPCRRADPPARGPRRRRRVRAGHHLRRRTLLPQRRAPLLRRGPGDRRARHPVPPRRPTATAGPTSGGWCSPGSATGNTQLRVNGLFWGLDNWIYAANGRSDGEVRTPESPPEKAVSISRRDLRFRFRPEHEGRRGRGHRGIQPVRPGP